MRDVINLVRIIINGFSDTCTEVELFDLIFLSKTLQSYDNIMKLQTKGGKKTNWLHFFGDIMPQDAKWLSDGKKHTNLFFHRH